MGLATQLCSTPGVQHVLLQHWLTTRSRQTYVHNYLDLWVTFVLASSCSSSPCVALSALPKRHVWLAALRQLVLCLVTPLVTCELLFALSFFGRDIDAESITIGQNLAVWQSTACSINQEPG
jgi:hypothetical protein